MPSADRSPLAPRSPFAPRLAIAALTLASAAWWANAQPEPTPPIDQPVAPAAPSTQPATQPSIYDRLLGNAEADNVDRPIQPTGRQMVDRTSGSGAVAPGAPQLITRREGSYLARAIGRLTRATDGAGWELTLQSDGAALQDPPLKLLPNLKLMAMEQQLELLNRDVRFRVSGTITEYRGRNYLLVEEVVVVRDAP